MGKQIVGRLPWTLIELQMSRVGRVSPWVTGERLKGVGS